MGSIALKSKVLGCMVGSALGDAIGEMAFRSPQRDRLTKKIEQAAELRYTDDTAMAIGLAQSIISKRGLDQQHLGQTFSENFKREPWRGYASGPPSIFSLVEQTGIRYTEAARMLFRGKGSFGNGAAMRIGPVGLFFHQAHDLYKWACASAQVTHAHPVGMDGAAVQAYAVAQVVKLDSKEAFPSEEFIQNLIEHSRTPEIRKKMKRVKELSEQHADPEAAYQELGQTVAVQESLPFAVYSFLHHVDSFEECLYCAVLHGGDRDTLGAMACAVSGAYLGVEAIPQAWKQKLENRGHIEQLALTLVQVLP